MRWPILMGALLIAGLSGALVQSARQDRAVEARLDALGAEVRDAAKLLRQAPAAATAAASAPAPVQMDEGQLQGLASHVAERINVRQPEAAAASPGAAAEKAAAPREATAEQREAAQRAGAILDQAIARRALGDEDLGALRELVSKLDPPARDAVRLRLVAAINRDELEVDRSARLP